MASLYEIDQAIMNCVDLETGEVIDCKRLTELQIERGEKLEKVALWIKNLKSDAIAYKAEKDAFTEREKQAKNKIESLQKWLSNALEGQPMKTNRVEVSFRRSEAVQILDEDKLPKKYQFKKITYAPDKKLIKETLKSGLKIKGCTLVENQNIQIK